MVRLLGGVEACEATCHNSAPLSRIGRNTHVNLWASSTSTRTGRHRLSKPARDSRFFADDAVGLRFRETVLAFFFSCHRMNALPSLRSPDLLDVQWVADPGLMSSKDCSLSALQRHGIRAAFGVSASLTEGDRQAGGCKGRFPPPPSVCLSPSPGTPGNESGHLRIGRPGPQCGLIYRQTYS